MSKDKEDLLVLPMTLREWYAGIALQGLLSGLPTDIPAEDAYPPLQAATDAVTYADALLAELAKGGDT